MKVFAIIPLLLLPGALCAQPAQTAPAGGNAQTAEKTQQPVTREEQARLGWSRSNIVRVEANVDGSIFSTYDINKGLAPAIPQMIQSSRSEAEVLQKKADLEAKIKDALTDQQLLISEFKESGASVPRSVVAAEIEKRIKEFYNGDRTLYAGTLKRMGRTVLDDRREIEEWMIVDFMRRRFLRTNSEISPLQIQKYYNENKERYRQTESVGFRQITLFPGAAQTDADVRRIADEIISDVKAGKDFGELAKKYSKDDYRNDGGYAGIREVDKLNEKIAAALRETPDGGVTSPLDLTLAGGRLTLFIFKREEYRPAGYLQPEEVRDDIESQIVKDQNTIAQQELMERLREKYFVQYY